ncbi:MAG: PAS domain S-box protein [Pseudomonadota bacterium]
MTSGLISLAPEATFSDDATVEELQIAIDNSMTGISWLDADGVFQQVRRGYAQMLGYAAEELIGQSWTVTVVHEDVEEASQGYLEMLDTGRATAEIRGVRKDKSVFYKQLLLVKTMDENGAHNGHYCFMRDVTDRRVAEETERVSRAFATRLLDVMQDGLCVLDHDFKHIRVNKAFLDMTGFSESALIGQPTPLPFWPEEHVGRIYEKLTTPKTFSGGEFELIFKRANGERFPVLIHPSTTQDAHGQTVYLSTVKDVSERRAAAHRIAEADRLKTIGTLAGGIAHDLNNLLTPVLGYADVISQHPDDASDAIIGIQTAAERAQELIAQILRFSSESGQQAGSISLVRATKTALQFVQGSLPARVRVETRFEIDRDWVTGVEARVQLLIMNLMTNAGDAMGEDGGVLTVALEPADDDDRVKLIVSDTGSGMSDSVQERIFNPFFTTKAADSGTGLGLVMVKEAVDELGGDITVTSTPFRGSTFTVTLPLGEPIRVSAKQDVVAQENTYRILVVDDDPAVLSVCTMMLERLGHEVFCFESTEDARECDQSYDLLITDYHINGVSGLDFVETLAFDGPIVLMTGNYDSDNPLPDRIAAQVNKPFKLDGLRDVVASVMVNQPS